MALYYTEPTPLVAPALRVGLTHPRASQWPTATTWAASTAYSTSAVIVPTTNAGNRYVCTSGGTSGTTEPAWPSVAGVTVSDSGATWMCMGQTADVLVAPSISLATFITAVTAGYGDGSTPPAYGTDTILVNGVAQPARTMYRPPLGSILILPNVVAGVGVYLRTTYHQVMVSGDWTVFGTIAGLTATAAELNKNAGVVAGTASASKTAVLGAYKNLDVLALPVGGLAIGANAGTAVTASAAELNSLTSSGMTSAILTALGLLPTGSSVPFLARANVTMAQMNAGYAMVPVVTGKAILVTGFNIIARGGNLGGSGVTGVNLQDSAGTPIVCAVIPVAGLTTGVLNTPSTANVVLTTFATPLTTSKGLNVITIGGTGTTTVTFDVTVSYILV